MSGYCRVAPGHPVHQPYHDREYGFPVEDEAVLFERLSLEIFQAGLSWEIVLKKRAALNRAFASFSVDRVAAFDASDLERLLHDAAIIRNRRKIEAVIANAAQIQALRATSGSFSRWLAAIFTRARTKHGSASFAKRSASWGPRLCGNSCSAPAICRAPMPKTAQSTR